MSDGELLLANILNDPACDTSRLVYADWLEEHGEDHRAARIRRYVAKNTTFGPHRVGQVGPRGYTGIPASWGDDWRVVVFRGFVCRVELSCAEFMQHAADIFAAQPVTELMLVDFERYLRGTHTGKYWWATDAIYDHDAMPAACCPDGEYSTLQLAMNALSAACVTYGRQQAKLPPLPAHEGVK